MIYQSGRYPKTMYSDRNGPDRTPAESEDVILSLRKKRAAGPAPRHGRDGLLSEKAYEQIRSQILTGDLRVGDVLSRRRLADRLNMSFLPVTEALQRLEAEGLVESRPRVGTRVRVPTKQDILDSYVIREALESQAARLCAEHINTEEKKQLQASARQLDELQRLCGPEGVDSGFLFSVHSYHMQFHMRIADLSRCQGLRTAIERERVLVFNWVYDLATGRNTSSKDHHAKLAAAVCSGDPFKADEVMRMHVRYGMEQVLEWFAGIELGDDWRHKRIVN